MAKSRAGPGQFERKRKRGRWRQFTGVAADQFLELKVEVSTA